ncbi:efflux RND transporter permease subunit [Halogeometricum luteum]|uniref:MMPL family transporter n=1 Tax=Halogeometricum luteum TaxID=2950537 RepID=A0ABU2G3K0_9EURY|nr:MMPL family transporter [Halogeometricum sp. S3BR5-2]MDS0295367.1 MMPL family transporter [Halogeometricum sp. S3BR5-2]
MDYQQYIDTVDDLIVERSRTVLLVFIAVTLVLSAGLPVISTEAGTSEFTNDVPAQTALENVNDEFLTQSFEEGSGSTQLIQRASNVLSKDEQLKMLRAQHRMQEHEDLRVESTTSVAGAVAQTLDPEATTLEAQVRTLERASDSEVESATRKAIERNPGLESSLSNDYNRETVEASATIGIVTHRLPGSGTGSSAGTSGDSPLTPIQQKATAIVASVGGSISVFGSGLISAELSNVIADSLLLVVPAALLLILGFLVYSYRDPFDLFLGVVCLAMAIVWTFGFMGLAGIAFSQMLIAVPVLLLAVGIDFGIHAVNRYREERVQGYSVADSMRTATDQLLVAFAIVTGTTVIGFLANLTSDLQPIRDFGLVAGIGIIFTFLIFGVFLPAAKVHIDRFRERRDIPFWGQSPLGEETSLLGRILPAGVRIGQVAPVIFLIGIIVVTAGVGSYGMGVESRFSQDDFLPPEDNPAWLESLPEPFAPSDYTVTETTNYLENNFQSGQSDTVTVYVEGPLYQDSALEQVANARDNPPDSFISERGEASSTSIVTIIQDYADESQEFRQLVERNDINGNGIPDDNLKAVYAALLSSPYESQAKQYISEDYRSARIVYDIESGAEQAEVTADAQAVADRFRYEATATGQTIVLKAVSDVIATSALTSLAIALLLTALFLIVAYYVTVGYPTLGIVNLVPIAVAIAFIAGTMRYANIPLNAMTGTILSIAVGLGVDYSAHMVHRFAEEYEGPGTAVESLYATVRGTGGALTASMLTTVTGIGVLVIALTPILGQFGMVIAISIFYSYLASVVVLPSTLVVWDRYIGYKTTMLTNKKDVKSV